MELCECAEDTLFRNEGGTMCVFFELNVLRENEDPPVALTKSRVFDRTLASLSSRPAWIRRRRKKRVSNNIDSSTVNERKEPTMS